MGTYLAAMTAAAITPFGTIASLSNGRLDSTSQIMQFTNIIMFARKNAEPALAADARAARGQAFGGQT